MTTLLLTPLIEELRNGARCETISYPWLRAVIAMPDLRGACLVGGCYLGSLSLVFRRCRIIAEVNLACIKALILPLRGGQLGGHIYIVCWVSCASSLEIACLAFTITPGWWS